MEHISELMEQSVPCSFRAEIPEFIPPANKGVNYKQAILIT